MCPPLSGRHACEGVSHLYVSWLYQLQHGQMRSCFACFKMAFLELKDSLEVEDWDDTDSWDPEPEPEEAEGPGQPVPGGPEAWGAGASAATAGGSEELGTNVHFVPTQLDLQDVVALCRGPEDSDWTQELPWRFGDVPSCTHWPISTALWQEQLRCVREMPLKEPEAPAPAQD
ncbi:testis-expressed protein 19 [Ochotona princeps]|uniref:testis-expressed protein 19 n=1 Tax=Ochotona princeps TaxID=9978 RepID=UPI0027151A17|nr:testis-expressed protein 19 [Ochotona princeps]